MILTIDHASPEPLYLQIRSQVVAAIAREELRPGDRLPTVRALASDLGINLHTVNKAYALLRDEGLLVIRGRNGAHVADFAQTATAATHEEGGLRLAEALRQLAIEHRARGGTMESFLESARTQAEQIFSN